MDSIGNYFKRAREERKLPIAQVVRDTKINEKYVIAIEAGDFSRFPSPAYAKGFVKIYAGYLGIDPQPALRVLAESPAGMVRPAFNMESEEVATNLLVTPWRYTAIGIGAAVILVIVVIAVITATRSCRQADLREPALPRGEELETLPLPSMPELEPTVVSGEAEAPAEPSHEGALRLRARAGRDNVWMKVYVDKVLVFQGTVPRGKEETWEGSERIHLRMGRPGALDLELNGKALEAPPDKKAQNLVIDKNGEITFYSGAMRKE
jgi:hypothetical protein